MKNRLAYLAGGAGFGAMVAGGLGAAVAGAGVPPAPEFLSYKPITSRVMSMVLEAKSTGVWGLLTSITSTKPLSVAYLLSTAIILPPNSSITLRSASWT